MERERDEACRIARRCYWLLKPHAKDEATGKPLHVERAVWLMEDDKE